MPKQSSIQITERGGNKAAAIATPATDSLRREKRKDKIATSAQNTAIKRSKIFGLVRANISEVSIFNDTTQLALQAIRTVKIKLNTIVLAAINIIFFSHLAIPQARALSGLKKGAISIAPIITATEF